jgi:type VI secretion system secreted protein VgrG
LAIGTQLGDDVLLLRRATVVEHLGRPFQVQADLLSETHDIDFKKIVGSNATIRLEQRDGNTRYFNGYVSRFLHTGGTARSAHYRMTLSPWLWFLTRTSNCRMFQDMKAPDILMKVFKEKGFNDYDLALKGTYNTRGYTVQYRETDFNFVQRIMEEEGIYYYWEHQNGKHVMVLADGYASHEPAAGFETVPYYPKPPSHEVRAEDYVWEWVVEQEVQPGIYALNDFDPLAIKTPLYKQNQVPREHAVPDFEMYDYPGGYDSTVDGEAIAKIRIEEWQAQHEIVRGRGDVHGLAVGYTFTLADFPRESQNKEHLVLSAVHTMESDEYNSTLEGEAAVPTYGVSFTALLATTQYRPRRITQKPVVHGPQTALVTGPSGEEIHTDKYGRVKVQFHWDRESKADDTSSCWIRVAQLWAGKKWGAIFLPRVGHEVIVDFLEGDPDRPIIVGSVYNNVAMPPYDLPAKKTVSTIKTDSSKGSGGFNEIKFEDEKGKEHLFIHAEKDEHVRVKNDALAFVGKDRHAIVKGNEKLKVEGDQHQFVKGSQREKVGGDRDTIIVGEDLYKATGKVYTKLGSDRMVEVTGDDNTKVSGAMNLKVTGALSIEAGGNVYTKSGGDIGVEATGDVHIKGTNIVIEGSASVTITAGGGSFITLGADGVMVTGSAVGVNSGGSAGAGGGCKPIAPTAAEEPDAPLDPTEAMDEKPGEKTETQKPKPPKVKAYSAQAQVLKQAAKDGTPFCEKCEEARKKQEAQKSGSSSSSPEPAMAGAGV